jgi:hypothetical protein
VFGIVGQLPSRRSKSDSLAPLAVPVT